MTTASQAPVRDRRSEEQLAPFMMPWVDKTVGLVAAIAILSVAGCGGGDVQNSSGAQGPYTIGGTIAGLSGSGLVLLDNGGNDLTVSTGATSFTFTTPIATGVAYSVTVLTQPSSPSQTCAVTNGSGTMASARVTSVAVSCAAVTYAISGTIAGLSGSGLVLLDNGGDDLTVSVFAGTAGTTSFKFPTAVASGGTYSVTVLSQPSNPPQTCTVGSGSGTVTGADVTNVAITCLPLPKGFVGFVATGSMTIGRDGPTATLLNNGKVLIAGGDIDINTTTGPAYSAELYDPATGTFTATGSMTTVREGQTATLLNDGQVLIAGGDNGDCDSVCALGSAELYNPVTGAFSTTGNMTESPLGYTATLLNNGKVLIAGGYIGISALSDAELYDPTTGTFTATGSMTTARSGHSAALLNNGQVLIAGGVGTDSTGELTNFASAELYDPATGTFTATGNMTTSRAYQTSTLLNNGQVLITSSVTAELYDPATGTFAATGSMTTALGGHTATLLNNGQVLMAGGDQGVGINGDVYSRGAELYDPTNGTFDDAGIMTTARDGQTATLLNNGDVLVAGGVASSSPTSPYLASAELYLPATLTPTGLVSITLTPATSTLPIGSTQQFIATGTFTDGSMQNLQSVTWSSSNQAVSTITNDASDRGVALAVAAGTSTITASAGSVSGSTVLTVH